MSVKIKEFDNKQKFADVNKTKDIDSLIALTKVLGVSSQELRTKWCKQLLYKLYIIHYKFENAQCNICLDNLKVDANNNLVLINVSENQDSEISVDIEAKTQVGVNFKAPELINCNGISKAGDIWATGICIYYINNLSFPWKIAAKSDKNFFIWANKGVFPKSIDNCYAPVTKEMLSVESQIRPNIKNVIKQTCDTGIDKVVLGKMHCL